MLTLEQYARRGLAEAFRNFEGEMELRAITGHGRTQALRVWLDASDWLYGALADIIEAAATAAGDESITAMVLGLPEPPPPVPTAVGREHALEHMLVAMVRRYGYDGRRAVLTMECIEGNHSLSIIPHSNPERIELVVEDGGE